MNNIIQAKKLFQSGDYTCVLCKDNITYTSSMNGITPMVAFITAGTDLSGFSAADKIVGKAAAMLFVLAGVREVYACVISEQAVEVFIQHDVQYSYDTLVQNIINRTGTDLCPMEQAVNDIQNPSDAFYAIKQKLSLLKKKSME